jgi:hypothetical protein
MLIVGFIFGAAEGAFALDGPCQPAPGSFIGNGAGEVGAEIFSQRAVAAAG